MTQTQKMTKSPLFSQFRAKYFKIQHVIFFDLRVLLLVANHYALLSFFKIKC